MSSWYSEGLKFKCTGCGKCCTGAPGYVWVNEKEMQEMADFLQMPLKTFIQRYVRRVGNRFSLVEMKQTFDCIFLKDKKCEVYGARPIQCRTYPFWPQNLKSSESWNETAKECEGINEEVPCVPFETIEENRLRSEKKDS